MSFRKKEVEEIVAEVEEKIQSEPEIEREIPKKDLISTGSTLLNLALSDYPYGGYRPGRLVHIIGDTTTYKTGLLLSMFAEAANDSRFDDYELLIVEPESGFEFDIEKMFGSKLYKRLKFLPEDRTKPCTIQDWYNIVFDYIVKRKKQCIIGLDSFDALTTEEEIEDGKKGDLDSEGWKKKSAKATASSTALRQIVNVMSGTQSLMVVISQTRANLGVTFGPQTTCTGGNAWKFYSTQAIVLSHLEKITKRVRGDEEEIGAYIKVKVKKNRVTGKKRKVKLPILDALGVDDIRSMIEWMIEKGFWETKKDEGEKKSKVKDVMKMVIDTCGDFIDGKIPEIIEYIETNNLEDNLKKIVWSCWKEIEEELDPKRKPRYE